MYVLINRGEIVTSIVEQAAYHTRHAPLTFTTLDEALKAAPKYGPNVTVAKLVPVAHVKVEKYERVVIDPLLGET